MYNNLARLYEICKLNYKYTTVVLDNGRKVIHYALNKNANTVLMSFWKKLIQEDLMACPFKGMPVYLVVF